MKTNPIIAQKKPSSNRKSRLSGNSHQFSLPMSIQERKEASSYLEIASVPVAERIDPKKNCYILLIQPKNVRACGGQYTADEAFQIAQAVKGWNWELDSSGRPKCLPALEALLDRICKRSGQGGAS